MEIETRPMQIFRGSSISPKETQERMARMPAESKAASEKKKKKVIWMAEANNAASCEESEEDEEDSSAARNRIDRRGGILTEIETQERQERFARMRAELKAAWDKEMVEIRAEMNAAWEKREKRLLAGEEEEDDEEDYYYATQTAKFKDTWNMMYSGYFGSFEDTTNIPNKRFTYKKPAPEQFAGTSTTLQIFSLKVARIKGGLQWPLHVFGMVAVRDTVDHNRNIIFDRPRHNCQILTQDVPYLQLMGPRRAVVMLDPLTFEIDLKVKGATESEDKSLSFLAVTYTYFAELHSHLLERDYASKLSTLELRLGAIVGSVEATVDVRVTSGSWPHGFRAQFAASTDSLGDAVIILLDSGDDKVPVAGYYGRIMLSRCVVSVEVLGRLRLSVKAWQGGEIVAHRKRGFKARKDGASAGTFDVGFCKMEVSVAWSLISIF